MTETVSDHAGLVIDHAARQRMRAAQVAARYKHKPADYERSAALVEDEFGFKIDPQVARTIRNN